MGKDAGQQVRRLGGADAGCQQLIGQRGRAGFCLQCAARHGPHRQMFKDHHINAVRGGHNHIKGGKLAGLACHPPGAGDHVHWQGVQHADPVHRHWHIDRIARATIGKRMQPHGGRHIQQRRMQWMIGQIAGKFGGQIKHPFGHIPRQRDPAHIFPARAKGDQQLLRRVARPGGQRQGGGLA